MNYSVKENVNNFMILLVSFLVIFFQITFFGEFICQFLVKKVLLQYLIVGVADEEDLLPSVPEPKKRKMFQCPSCKPSRSFSDEKKFVEHMDVSHVFD